MFKAFHLAGVLFVSILVPSILMIATEPQPADAQVACTADAKLCPDGSYVGRDHTNNCAWYPCPGEEETDCSPYVCANGKTHPRCAEDGTVINYFAPPCHTDGGEAGAPFQDVSSAHANADAIFYVKSEGIVEGYADGTYKPDTTINRAEFVKVLVGSLYTERQMYDGLAEETRAHFFDVEHTSWYEIYAHFARWKGMVDGYSDGTFRPANAINFAEAAKILVKAFDLEASTTIPACDGDCPWYWSYVLMLEMRGAIPTSIVRFDQNITRGEMAEMIYRLKTGDADKPSRTYEELASVPRTSAITLHFFTQQDVQTASYEANFPVTRSIPHTTAVADAALRALFAGPTADEYARGARTMDELSRLAEHYIGVTIHREYPNPYFAAWGEGEPVLQGVALVNFKTAAYQEGHGINGPVGTSAMLQAALQGTLKAFPTVNHVLYLKDGEIFTEWDA